MEEASAENGEGDFAALGGLKGLKGGDRASLRCVICMTLRLAALALPNPRSLSFRTRLRPLALALPISG